MISLTPLVLAQCTLLIGELAAVLGLQCTSLRTGALGARLPPCVDDIHPPGDAGLDHACELIAVAGHGSGGADGRGAGVASAWTPAATVPRTGDDAST